MVLLPNRSAATRRLALPLLALSLAAVYVVGVHPYVPRERTVVFDLLHEQDAPRRAHLVWLSAEDEQEALSGSSHSLPAPSSGATSSALRVAVRLPDGDYVVHLTLEGDSHQRFVFRAPIAMRNVDVMHVRVPVTWDSPRPGGDPTPVPSAKPSQRPQMPES